MESMYAPRTAHYRYRARRIRAPGDSHEYGAIYQNAIRENSSIALEQNAARRSVARTSKVQRIGFTEGVRRIRQCAKKHVNYAMRKEGVRNGRCAVGYLLPNDNDLIVTPEGDRKVSPFVNGAEPRLTELYHHLLERGIGTNSWEKLDDRDNGYSRHYRDHRQHFQQAESRALP
jgi:hypothetical protein